MKTDTSDPISPFIDDESVNQIRKALAYTVGFIGQLKNKNLLNDTWDIISKYISQGFSKMGEEMIGKFLKNLVDAEPNLLRSIDDDVVIKWNFKNFILFTGYLEIEGA